MEDPRESTTYLENMPPRGRFGRFLQQSRPRYLLARAVLGLIPAEVGLRVRTRVYRAAGFRGLHPSVEIKGRPELRGWGDLQSKLSIGRASGVNTPLFIDLHAPVRIGERVGIGHHVVISTSSHETEDPRVRSGRVVSAPVIIEDGAWIGAGAIILSGVVIGRGAVVGAGSVVAKSVPPNAKVAGNPARVVGWMPAASAAAPSGLDIA